VQTSQGRSTRWGFANQLSGGSFRTEKKSSCWGVRGGRVRAWRQGRAYTAYCMRGGDVGEIGRGRRGGRGSRNVCVHLLSVHQPMQHIHIQHINS
jgi:hypothetical protein